MSKQVLKQKQENVSILIRIPKELKSKLDVMAKEDNRSFNNLVVTLLQKSASDVLIDDII